MYIAAMPVKFDRVYTIGEVIPDGKIDPKAVKTLAGLGKIALVPGGKEDEDASKPKQTRARRPAEQTEEQAAERPADV